MTTTDETKITISKGNLTISTHRPRHLHPVVTIGSVERDEYASSGYAALFNEDVSWDLEGLQDLTDMLSALPSTSSQTAPLLFIYLDEGYNDE